MLEIRSALEQRDAVAALEAFTKARNWFAQAVEASETRPEAELYLLSLNLLLAFQKGRRAPPSSEEALAIRKAAFDFAAFSTPSSKALRASWLGERVEETLSWQELALTLAQLSQSLLDDVWLNAAAVIERQILRAYSASRAILKRSSDGSLEEIVRPVIEDAIQQSQLRLELLAKWVQHNAGSEMILDAELLQRKIAELRESGGRQRNPTKAASSDEVVAVLESGLVTSAGAERALRHIQDAYLSAASSLSLILLRQFEKLTATLMKNPHYAEEASVREYFDLILINALNFHHIMENIEEKRRPSSAYIFDLTTGKDGPQEANLQHDYLAAMQMSPLNGVRYEESGKSHGRADVSFTSSNMSIVAEIKQGLC